MTIDRGFQRVCTRWDFKRGPASHGVTKTHRRGGKIDGIGEKGRVWPGTGHMGNRSRTLRGCKIIHVNTKYNIIWILGHAIPGATNSFCYIYDTVLPLKKNKTASHFPTYLPTILEEQPLQEDLFSDELHPLAETTIKFSEET